MSKIEYKEVKNKNLGGISSVGRREDGVSGKLNDIEIICKKHRSQLDNKKEIDKIFALLEQPTPQTFEELAEVLGADIQKYVEGCTYYIMIYLHDKNIFYTKDRVLRISNIYFNNISPPQAYEIITVMQRNIGG